MALQHRSDPGGIKKETTDVERDIAAKGGPAIGLGDPQNRQVPSPATENLQTQVAANRANTNKASDEGGPDEPTMESQTKKRSGNQASGSNH
jgi:hypothetical protein